MTSWLRFMVLALCLGCPAACRDDIEPAKGKIEDARPEPVGDVTKVARFKADTSFLIPYVAIIFEEDSTDPAWMRVTLASTQTGPDGARLFFQSDEKVRTLSQMKSESIDFSSSAFLSLNGNGFFTATSAYQPKFVSIRLTDFDDHQVSGTISGEFYKFRLMLPAMKPMVVTGDATFTAARAKR